jgi:hypothetical protein
MAIISNVNSPFNSTNFNSWVSSQAAYQATQTQALITTSHSDSWTTAVNQYYAGQARVDYYYDHSKHHKSYDDSAPSPSYTDYGNISPSYYDHSDGGSNNSPSYTQYQPSGYKQSYYQQEGTYHQATLKNIKARLNTTNEFAHVDSSNWQGVVRAVNESDINKIQDGFAHIDSASELGIISGGYSNVPYIAPSYANVPAVHTDNGFDHSNYVPSAPALFQIVNGDRLKDSVTIG